MTKSRMAHFMTLLLLAAAAAEAVAASPGTGQITAEEAIRRQRDGLRRAAGIGCQRGADEIVVCGRGGERLAFPEEPGRRERLVAGEPPRAAAAAQLGACCQPRGGIDVLGLGSVVAKGLGKIF